MAVNNGGMLEYRLCISATVSTVFYIKHVRVLYIAYIMRKLI